MFRTSLQWFGLFASINRRSSKTADCRHDTTFGSPHMVVRLGPRKT